MLFVKSFFYSCIAFGENVKFLATFFLTSNARMIFYVKIVILPNFITSPTKPHKASPFPQYQIYTPSHPADDNWLLVAQ